MSLSLLLHQRRRQIGWPMCPLAHTLLPWVMLTHQLLSFNSQESSATWSCLAIAHVCSPHDSAPSACAGMYGGSVANSLHALAEFVAGLHLPNGSIAIPGFYE